jgi:membrane-associated protein
MFSQGANNKSFKVVWLAGLLNLPYYLLLIAGTAVLSEQVMSMAENSVLLFSMIGIWLLVSVIYDVRKHKRSTNILVKP